MKDRWLWIGGFLALILIGVGIVLFPLNAQAQPEFTYAGETPAPAFPEELAWLNVERPLTLEDLQGKVVLLDFWTYGCINCIHVIPELKRLEAEYPNELVVIGVHSAKFEGEGLTDNIRQIVQRYGVTHPVINDVGFTVWNQYGVQAWPTIGLIDPEGKIVGGKSGEGVYDFFKPIIDTMVQEYGAAGLLDPEKTLPLAPELNALAATPLSFPSKLVVDAPNNRLFIADTGHHRIVVTTLDNFEVQQIIGSGEAGLLDGDFTTAQFDTPYGMDLVGETLYVADTNNHAIRAVDLATGTVTRVAGTGNMSTFLMAAGEALTLDLRSPWDVEAQDGILYIAMAGSHQLWSLDLATSEIKPFAGNGREDLIDGARDEAELAQPSDVISDGEFIYFADSESSSIRRAGISEDTVETVIGPVNEAQGRLFTFGDVDGGINEARLQHPLGVTIAEDGLLYIADTYNNKIKVIDPVNQTSSTFMGDVDGGYFDGAGEEALFDEPGGLEYHDGKLYVADTNNHAIRIIDMASQSVSTVIFPNVSMLLPSDTAANDEPLVTDPLAGVFASDQVLTLEPQTVQAGDGVILVDAVMPFGYKLNAQAPFTALWTPNNLAVLPEDQLDYQVIVPDLPIEFPVSLTEGETELSVDLTIYWCEAINETLCFVERSTVIMPITVVAEANTSKLYLNYTLTPPTIDNNLDGG